MKHTSMPDASTTLPNIDEPARKRGRPRKPPQQGPIIATTIRSQVARRVTMGAYTEREFISYIEWASRELNITKQHATTVFFDRAICDLLNKDGEWKKFRRANGGAETDEHPPAKNTIDR